MGKGLGRRRFLQAAAGVAGAAALAPDGQAAPPREAPTAPHVAHRPRGASPDEAFLFLNQKEIALVTAAVDIFLPADDVGPGGVEAGVVHYIDRQMAGGWGAGGRMYMAGPWAEGTPQQGYQLPMPPAAFLRAGLAELEQMARQGDGKPFTQLPFGRRDQILRGLESGELALPSLPGKIFLILLLNTALEGYFADPAHGGNKAMAAWRMIGFPGARGAYVDDIVTYRGKPFTGEPVSLADLQ